MNFEKYFMGKIRSVVDKYGVKGRIAVALSGGKDSMAAFHALTKFKFELIPFYIDLGIEEYSKACMEYAKKICDILGYKLQIIKLKDYGIDLSKARKKCSVCGTAKRYLMNKFAFEHDCDYVATGHNLSDALTFAFNNLASVNILNFRGMKPVLPGNKDLKMAGRFKPLFYLKDDECMEYVKMNEIPYCKEKCPYARDAPTIELKEWIHEMERKRNGIMLNFAKSFEKIEEMMTRQQKIRQCSICGYPSYGNICKFCKLRRKYGKI
ncbi:MAG: TIGR00269 family protein [Thermoplasmata archaeon]|nr:TIGR00269 family protein [Thermoplasmata archaeon]